MVQLFMISGSTDSWFMMNKIEVKNVIVSCQSKRPPVSNFMFGYINLAFLHSVHSSPIVKTPFLLESITPSLTSCSCFQSTNHIICVIHSLQYGHRSTQLPAGEKSHNIKVAIFLFFECIRIQRHKGVVYGVFGKFCRLLNSAYSD